jgi:O-methyltransferase
MTVKDRIREAGRLILGSELDTINQIVRRDARCHTFFRAIEFINYEQVPGDIVECGVFGGLSLALLAKGATFDAKGMSRRIVGIDSFEGLPLDVEQHPRWNERDCAVVHGWHPFLNAGDRVSAESTRALFDLCGLDSPILHTGRFGEVLPRIVPSLHDSIALLHVDCDLYESTREVLDGVASALQDGTIILFDDWFHYRGNPHRGEARAFREFLAEHPEWEAVHWTSYATFCNAFILSRQ